MKNKTFLPDSRPANVSLSAAADYDVMGAAPRFVSRRTFARIAPWE
jgi:hypothetical protein